VAIMEVMVTMEVMAMASNRDISKSLRKRKEFLFTNGLSGGGINGSLNL
jgi:hypothetical protein